MPKQPTKKLNHNDDSSSQIVDKNDMCFIISPIGSIGEDRRKRSDAVKDHLISPAALKIGFTLNNIKRADDVYEPGSIINKVIKDLFDAKMVVADLTDLNPNVLFELGIRYSFNKPVVQIAHVDQIKKLPFDIVQQRTIPYDHHDISIVQSTIEAIFMSMKTCLVEPEDGFYDNPVNAAIKTKFRYQLPESPNGEPNTETKVLMNMINDLSTKLNKMESANTLTIPFNKFSKFSPEMRTIDRLERSVRKLTRIMNEKPIAVESARESYVDRFDHELLGISLYKRLQINEKTFFMIMDDLLESFDPDNIDSSKFREFFELNPKIVVPISDSLLNNIEEYFIGYYELNSERRLG